MAYAVNEPILIIEGRRYRKSAQGDFEIPLSELGTLRFRDVHPLSSIRVTDLPVPAHSYLLDVKVTHAGSPMDSPIAVAFNVRFGRSLYDHSISSSVCIRRLRHIRTAFLSVVKSGVVSEGVDHLVKTSDGWQCGILYSRAFSTSEQTPIRDIVTPLAEAYVRLVCADYRMLSICFAADDKPFVEKLASALDEQQGYDLWYERREIRAGRSLAEGLNRGLKEATHVLVVVSRRSTAQNWLNSDLSPDLLADLAGGPIPLLPVVIDSSQLPRALSGLRHADFRADFQKGVSRLLTLVSDRSGRR
jgi:hypothetical protein